jgi:hypothetical protein
VAVQQRYQTQDDARLTSLIVGVEPIPEQPYIHTLDFEIKEQDVRKLNSKMKIVPENAGKQSANEVFGDVLDDTTKDVVAIPLTAQTEEDVKSKKSLMHYNLGHIPYAAINQMARMGELPRRLASVGDPMCAA